MSEAAWNKAFTQGSRDLQNRLMKVHAKNPKFQTWLKSSGHGAGTSVKQASKEVKPSARVKSLQTKSLQAYGATKGVKVGGEHGSDEVRDTIAPLTRDQHSKVQAAERAAKAAAAKAAPKVKKPLTQAQRMAAIAAAVRKGKAKHDVATVDPDDVDHDDLRDVHQSLHVSRGYNEEVEVDESVATAQKVMDRANVVAKTNPDPKKRFAASGLAQKAMMRTINPTGVNTGITRGGGNKTYRMVTGKVPPYQLTKKTGVSEEVEQIEELKLSDVLKATHGKSPEEKQKIIKAMREKERASRPPAPPEPKPVAKDIPMHQRVYPNDMKYHGDSVELEGPVMNEVSQKEAEKLLGGPVKTKPTNAPAGKLPYGFRRARNLARQAMKAGKQVTESTTEVSEVNEMNHGKKLAKMIMAKQSQHPIAQNMGEENIVEQDDSMEKKEMAQTQLHFIKYAAEEILAFIDMGGEVEEWYQNKLSKVQSEVESLHSYIEGEKRRTGMVKEEEQIDEVKAVKAYDKEGKLVGRYRSMDHAKQMKPGHTYKVEEEVEQVDEKAPPGAKYERMVKHIKKGYAKGGLTPKEKSIAYATAWKAYGKKEEVEVVAEAEGTVAVTPKEKALAVHHGDPKKITYGDVIKARLKSAAAKKMGNK